MASILEDSISLNKIESIFSKRRYGAVGKYRFFSVLVPLVEKGGELCLLYEVRADTLKRQPGEVCFPGGNLEKGETPKECAIRETCEELGVRKEDIRIINQLDSLHNYSNFTMYCFLGVIKLESLQISRANEAEVKEIFLVPLKYLMENEPFVYEMEVRPIIGEDFPYDLIEFDNGYYWRKGVSEVPIYRFGGRPIWGITGRITHNLIKIIKQERE